MKLRDCDALTAIFGKLWKGLKALRGTPIENEKHIEVLESQLALYAKSIAHFCNARERT